MADKKQNPWQERRRKIKNHLGNGIARRSGPFENNRKQFEKLTEKTNCIMGIAIGTFYRKMVTLVVSSRGV